MRVLSATDHPVVVVCMVSGGSARRHRSRLSATSAVSGPQSGNESLLSMSGETCVPVDMIL